MATSPIEEVDVLKVLGIYFHHKLTWSSMIDHLTTCCHQRLRALFCVWEYLGKSGLVTPISPLLGLCVNMVMVFYGCFCYAPTQVGCSTKGSQETVSDYISILVISSQGQRRWPAV